MERMRFVIVVGVASLVAACATRRNPAFCGDGVCVDPSRPFCDVDATLGADAPGTCIAVSCEPKTFAECRGDLAITCNGDGNDYELVQCPMGCGDAAMGCKQCATNAQCTPTQVCDSADGVCRGCRLDDECDSRVCDGATGACVAESEVVYAAPDIGNGSGAACTRQAPCSFDDAAGSAFRHLPPLTVRMLRGHRS